MALTEKRVGADFCLGQSGFARTLIYLLATPWLPERIAIRRMVHAAFEWSAVRSVGVSSKDTLLLPFV